MSLPPVIRPKTERSVAANRHTPPPLMALRSRWSHVLPWAAAGLALLIGFGAGYLVTRHRHASQKIVAAVNGVVITEDALNGRLQGAAGQAMVHKMVEEMLQMQFAAKQGVPPTDAQVEARYQEASKDPRFQPALVASGMSLTDYKQSLRVKLALSNVLTQGVTVSDAEVRDFYKAQINPANPSAQFYTPETITLRVIASPTQQQSEQALQELNNNTPFDLAASEFSVDPSKTNGGLIQPLQRGRSPISRMPSLENALFNMKVGQLYGPVSFNKGWWIFRCEEKSVGKALPFDTVKDECRLGAEVVKGTKLKGRDVETKFQEFERGSSLQAFWPQYQRAVTGR